MTQDNELAAIDIFSGAGGMSVGAALAGINVKVSIELDKHAADTYKVNHPNTKVLQADISTVNPLEHIEKHPFILFGGPPCQGFSLANTRTRSLENPNNWMFKEYLRFVDTLKPEWFVFENVEGFASFNNGEFSKDVKDELKQLGYTISSRILNASDYGVPQNRFRYFIVGHKINSGGIEFDFNALEIKPSVNVYDAIFDLPLLKNGQMSEQLKYKCEPQNEYAQFLRSGMSHSTQNFVSKNNETVIERYKVIKQGQNWKAAKEQGLMTTYTSTHNTHSGIYKRLEYKGKAPTISNYRKSMIIHPTQHRGLSLREAARIQSFPDSYQFMGPLSYMQQQVGNAVPPLLAKAIFEKVVLLSKK
ncbi:DNA cytosine methyltransferase [Thiomicrorhabdus sp.]|uniref:DNA cytosine methyltransferase n=1 Tax=Thiomicrorhabdus sp. TaxID=2039724 RepID=UPI0029C7B83F|nr:DNA cytosine methyltransferase [Thiomicrorhabdus sp.]